MAILTKTDVSRRRVAAVGMFDGVHRGHRHLLHQVIEQANASGLTPAVVTFSSHPSQTLTPDSPVKQLTATATRLELLEGSGAKDIILLDFNKELQQLSAQQFLGLLHHQYAVDALLVGFNNRFGHNRAEGFDDYVKYGKEIGISVLKATEAPDGKVSSSIIRQLIADGQVKEAAHELGRHYELEGTVVGGKRIGRTIGYPTANIALTSPLCLIPKGGAYVACVHDVDTNKIHMAMVNIGTRPTVNNGSDISIEAHILDFEENIYGHKLRVAFIQRLRDEMRFNSLDELTTQLAHDASATRQIFNSAAANESN